MTQKVVSNLPSWIALPRIIKKKNWRISTVWIIPIVAAILGAGIAYKSISERGPTVTLTFRNAAGLEAGVTRVKYKNVEIGEVERVEIHKDLTHIVVTVRLTRDMEPHLGEGARFWVVRPRIGLKGVSGLSTLISGAYIEFERGTGPPCRTFQGLEHPPVTPADAPGLKILLQADKLGSLNVGSPVYFRQIQVGEIESHRLGDDRQSVELEVFIGEPYDELVRENSRFWNVSGIDLSVGADGLSVKVEALEALLAGGISFLTPPDEPPSPPAADGAVFKLHESYKSIWENFTHKFKYTLYFDGSLRGLNAGAPVEFRGTQVGSVKDITLQYNTVTNQLQTPVLIEIEPQRLQVVGGGGVPDPQQIVEIISGFVQKGLRAQLKTRSLLTGQLFVEFEFHPEIPARIVGGNEKYPELPTIPNTIDSLQSDLARAANKMVPLISRIDETLEQTQKTLAALKGAMAPESKLQHGLISSLEEFTDAARSIRVLADYLEQHPEALIYGKGGK